jgi:demethylspheroidene O-methyltransferase
MPATSWREQWIGWRNRLLSSPRFQQWAADFPLTRPIARQRAQGLFDLVAGFVYSQTLAACVRLELFERLRGGPLSMAALAQALRTSPEATERLIHAAIALRLVDHVGLDRYALGPQGAALLGNAGLMQMIEHHQHLYADLADGVGLLRRNGGQGDLAAYWPYATSAAPQAASVEAVSAYSALMAATLPAVAADLFQAYPIQRHRRLMDVGGGEGAFLALAAAKAPALKLMLFDLPAVTQRARRRLACAGVLERAEIVSGDFLSEPVPSGADLITLVRILHDHDDAGVLALLRSIRAALPSDGALLIAEPMSAAPRTDRVADVYFAFYLLAMGRGRARTPDEISGLARAAGFGQIRNLRTRTPFLLRAVLVRP